MRGFGPRHVWRTDLLARTLLEHAPPEGPLLDAGCGPGTVAIKLAAGGGQVLVLAFDIALERVQETRDRARGFGLGDRLLCFVADAAALPLREASVAGASAGEVFEHIRDDRAAAREIARVIRRSGMLALTVPAGTERMSDFDRSVGHCRRYDHAGLVALMRDSGLEVRSLEAWGWPFGRVYDHVAQRPALSAISPIARRITARLGRSRLMHLGWRAVFALDAPLSQWAGERGSGWLAVARKPERDRC